MIHHTKAVARAVKTPLLIADLPMGCYEVTPEQGTFAKKPLLPFFSFFLFLFVFFFFFSFFLFIIYFSLLFVCTIYNNNNNKINNNLKNQTTTALQSAIRMIKECPGVAGIKIEGNQDLCPAVRKITSAGIPVFVQVGLTPQRSNQAESDQDGLGMTDSSVSYHLLFFPSFLSVYIWEKWGVDQVGLIMCDSGARNHRRGSCARKGRRCWTVLDRTLGSGSETGYGSGRYTYHRNWVC